MPERPQEPIDQSSEAEAKKAEQLEHMIEVGRQQLAEVFDSAVSKNILPTEQFLNEMNLENAGNVYGAERIQRLKSDVEDITYKDKQGFVDKLIDLLIPFLRDRVYDPQISERLAAIRQEEEQTGVRLEWGGFAAWVHKSENEFSLSDNVNVKPGDEVLELGYSPEEGTKFGAHSSKRFFKEVTKMLENLPNVKAVMLVSWMTGKGFPQRFGFEAISDVEIQSSHAATILDMAQTGRKDKRYAEGVEISDVGLAAMSREKFIESFS